MRKILLLAALGVFALTGVAYAVVTNVYVVHASITPVKSGTLKQPKSIATKLSWTVSTAPPGSRPDVVRGYKFSFEGIRENTIFFPGCGTSKLSGPKAGPRSCPRGSQIGTGFLIVEIGPTGQNNSSYNARCRAELTMFNGGNHNLTLFVYKGKQKFRQPPPCPIPGNHDAINITLVHAKQGLSETFSVPLSLLHPAPGFDAAVIQAMVKIRKRTLVLKKARRGRKAHTVIGLFETVYCPPNHQRQVVAVFTGEDGIGRTRTTLVRCKR